MGTDESARELGRSAQRRESMRESERELARIAESEAGYILCSSYPHYGGDEFNCPECHGTGFVWSYDGINPAIDNQEEEPSQKILHRLKTARYNCQPFKVAWGSKSSYFLCAVFEENVRGFRELLRL